MDPRKVAALLEQVRDGTLSTADAARELGELPFVDLGFARVDLHRALRQGLPEVVYGAGKTPEQISGIVSELARAGHDILVTRVAPEAAEVLLRRHPELSYNALARVVKRVTGKIPQRRVEPVLVVTAGTSDLPVAEEAIETLTLAGIPLTRVYDVGVAGLHRLLSQVELLRRAPAIIVIAGMEGALPSVVAGLVACPVIAVPTSVGYGTALHGFTALFGMLGGCASGLTVVNIDNGFGAAVAVHRLLTLCAPKAEAP